MLVPSPGCILNCQALSIHLPPLSETRDSSSQNKYLSSPMSTSPKQLRLVSPPQSHLSYQRQYSDSPTSTRSASNQPVSAKPQGPHSIGSRSEDLNCKVNTPNSCTDIDTRSSVPLSNYLQYLRECSIDELSSVAQDSPEVQQLAAGQPGIARRAKTHVPSACINCKRKHLACETKRPCNRCVQTGKEVRGFSFTILFAKSFNFLYSQAALMFNIRNEGGQGSGRKKVHVTLIVDVITFMGRIIQAQTA